MPRASANKLIGSYRGALKLALTAPPVEGAANKALVAFLADLLSLPRSAITIVAGETARIKTLRISGPNAATVLARISVHG